MRKLVLFLICSFAMMAAIAQSVNSNTNKDGAVTDTKNNAMPEYKGPCACGNPMTADVFDRLLSDIKDKGIDRSMFRFAKSEIKDKCLLASQVEEIMLLFMSTSYRNAFLAYSRTYTYDERNYYTLKLKYPNLLSVVPTGQTYNNHEEKAHICKTVNIVPLNFWDFQ